MSACFVLGHASNPAFRIQLLLLGDVSVLFTHVGRVRGVVGRMTDGHSNAKLESVVNIGEQSRRVTKSTHQSLQCAVRVVDKIIVKQHDTGHEEQQNGRSTYRPVSIELLCSNTSAVHQT